MWLTVTGVTSYDTDLIEQAKLNLEFDYLIVQFIYECNRAKGISYIVSGRRVGHRVMY